MEGDKLSDKRNVVLCFDLNYLSFGAVATYSAFIKTRAPLTFHWVFPRNIESEANRIANVLSNISVSLKLHPVETSTVETWTTKGAHFTFATYLRLFAIDLLGEVGVETALYLDSDTLCVDDISRLFDVSLDENLFAGVSDEGAGAVTKLPRPPLDPYINAGVLLINVRNLKNQNFLERAKQVYSKFSEKLVWADQCIINYLSQGKKYLLSEAYNKFIYCQDISGDDFKSIIRDQRVIIFHFLGSVKPWQAWCNPEISPLWWSYAAQVPGLKILPTRVTNINHLIELANATHRNGKFCTSSEIRQSIITLLIKAIGSK